MAETNDVARLTIQGKTEGVDQALVKLASLKNAQNDVAVATERTERVSLSAQAALDRLQRQVDPLYRSKMELAKAEKTLVQAQSQGLISLDRQSQLLELARARTLGLAAANSNVAGTVDKLGTAVKGSSAQVGGIAAQFQDVAVQLAGGQSPFLIALQQGTQLSGQLEATGGGIKSLGAAFLSLVSPVSLLTIGGIAAFGSLVQYVTGASQQVETLDDRLTKHAEIIRGIKSAYGEAAAGIDDYAKESARVADVQLRAVSEKLKADIAKVAREIGAMTSIAMPTSDTAIGVPQDLVRFTYEATNQYKAFREAVIQLRQGMDDGSLSIGRFRDEIAKVGVASNDANVRKLSDELISLTNEAFKAEQALGGSARAVGVLAVQAAAGAPAIAAYGAALRSLQMGVPDLAKALTATKEMSEASKAYADGAQGARDAMTAGGMTERASAAALGTYANRMKELNAAFEARKGIITGATDLEKTFGDTLRTTTIAGLEGVARGNAQAQASYQERNRQIAESIKLGMTEAEATKLRAQSEKILAGELRNVAAAEAKKGGGTSGKGAEDAFERSLVTAQGRTRQLLEEARLAGLAGSELDAMRLQIELETQAKKRGIEVTDQVIAKIQQEVDARRAASRAVAEARLQADIDFERSQVGRTSGEQQIASRLRSSGLGLDSSYADAMRLNQTLSETKGLLADAAKGFISDLRQGVSLSEALNRQADRLIEKLINAALDQAISGLFSSIGKSGGSGLGSIFASLFGGAGGSTNGGWASPSVRAANGHVFDGDITPFAKGGAFTRDLLTAPTLFKFARGGAVRTGLAGEAGPEAIMPLRRDSAGRLGVAAAGGGGAQFNMQVINKTGAEVKTDKRENDSGGFDIVTMIDQAVAESINKPGSASNRALRTNFGARQQLTRR
jgi:hypothetical protein